jgi:hypothetical protein
MFFRKQFYDLTQIDEAGVADTHTQNAWMQTIFQNRYKKISLK